MERLGDYVSILNGFAFKSSEYVNEGVRVLRITNVQKGEIRDDNPKFYPLESSNLYNRFLLKEGDLLMSLTGNVGRVGKVSSKLLPAYVNQRVCKLKVTNDKLDSDYLFHVLNSEKFEREAIANSSGIAQLNLSTKWLEDYSLSIPPLPTQKKIAAILDAADEHRQKTKALLEKYDELAQSIFLEMFGDPLINPRKYPLVKLSEVVKKDKIITYGIVQAGPNVNDGVIYIKSGDIKDGVIQTVNLQRTSQDIAKKYERSKCSSGDLIMSIRATVGTVAILPAQLDGANLTQGTARISADNSKVNTRFLLHCLRSKGIQTKINKVSKGATFREITLGRLREIQIPIPSLQMQELFDSRTSLINNQRNIAENQYQESENLFDSILQQAFHGQLTS